MSNTKDSLTFDVMKLRHVVPYILILFFPSFSFICLTYSMRLLQNLIKPLNQKFVTVRPQIIVDNLEFALIIELTFFLKFDQTIPFSF